jgi:hypothetical protein
MKIPWNFIFISILFLSLFGCGRPVFEKASIQLRFPKENKTAGSTNTSANLTSTGFVGNYPINCYVAMVSGPEAELQKNICERKSDSSIEPQKVGVWSGGITEGQNVSLDVPAGNDRTVLFGGFYSQNGSCVDFKKNNTGEGLSRFYLLGEVHQINLTGGQNIEINVPMNFDPNHWFDNCRGSDFNISISNNSCPAGASCGNTLNIISATYGQNCGQQDNRTVWLRDLCNGKSSCESCPLDAGDPAYGCGKDYVINYTCGATNKTYYGYPEAGFSNHLISCP